MAIKVKRFTILNSRIRRILRLLYKKDYMRLLFVSKWDDLHIFISTFFRLEHDILKVKRFTIMVEC